MIERITLMDAQFRIIEHVDIAPNLSKYKVIKKAPSWRTPGRCFSNLFFLISVQPVCDYRNNRTESAKTNYDAFIICKKFNRIKPGSILIGAHFLYILGIIIHLYIAKVVLVASLKL